MTDHMPQPPALRAAADVGPFFAVRTKPPGPAGPRAEGYVPLGEAYRITAAAPAPPLLKRIDAVATTLRTPERRVAASLAFQGLAARMWSLALGPAALSGRVPDLRPDRLWWNPARTAPDDLWWPGPLPRLGEPGGLAGHVAHAAYVHLLPLHAATVAACPISGRLLWGNAASALAGTLRVLRGWCREHGRPDAAARAMEITRGLFDLPPLRDTGVWGEWDAWDDGEGDPPDFRRHSCCLYYRVPGGGLCGDCALRRPPR